MALTFDDLPGLYVPGAPCDEAALLDMNHRLLAGLERNGVKAAGLVTGDRMCDDAPSEALPSLLREWLDAGHTLGNHTYSHRDLNAVSLEWYTNDIARNQRLLDDVGANDGGTRWFRAPMLHYGDTPAKHDGLQRYLDSAGYRIARVSVDNQEWIFADVYTRALAAGDSAVAERVAEAYVPFMESVIAHFEERTPTVAGRYPPQVLLLHVNRLNTDRLDPLVAMIRARGYRLVPMEEALADPWYDEPERYIGPQGLAWLHRLTATAGGSGEADEPREPAWLAALRRDYMR